MGGALARARESGVYMPNAGRTHAVEDIKLDRALARRHGEE